MRNTATVCDTAGAVIGVGVAAWLALQFGGALGGVVLIIAAPIAMCGGYLIAKVVRYVITDA